MSKYVIEIEEKPLCVFDKDTQTFFPRLWRVKGFNSLVIDEEGLSRLEELTSDYINEHFGDLQDTAYQKGYADGKKFSVGEAVKRAEYDKGLEDAWECVKKLYLSGMSKELFGRYFNAFIQEYSARQAIEMLKAHEQKKDDKIEVGDEVEVLNSGNKYLIAWFAGTSLCGFAHDGVTCRLQPSDVRKTGRHFDIDKILEEMRND